MTAFSKDDVVVFKYGDRPDKIGRPSGAFRVLGFVHGSQRAAGPSMGHYELRRLTDGFETTAYAQSIRRAECTCKYQIPRHSSVITSSGHGRYALYLDAFEDDSVIDSKCPYHGDHGTMIVEIWRGPKREPPPIPNPKDEPVNDPASIELQGDDGNPVRRVRLRLHASGKIVLDVWSHERMVCSQLSLGPTPKVKLEPSSLVSKPEEDDEA